MASSSRLMGRARRAMVAILAVVAVLAMGKAPAVARALPDEIVPLDQVRPGDRVTATTVFRGTEPETFEGEVLGIWRDFYPKRPIILVRFSGDLITRTGIAAGMSGSPVYRGDRLVGAIAYKVSAFPKEPVAGVTPIEQMLGEVRVPAPEAAASPRAVRPTPAPVWNRADVAPKAIAAIKIPLQVAGLHPSAVTMLAGRLERSPFQVMTEPAAPAAAGGGFPSASPLATDGLPHVEGAAIAPGAPIAAVLASGDIHIAATGTVTRVDRGRVFAFGHPFLYQGPTSVPMAQAEIVTTLADLYSSYKVANTGRIVGTLDSDGLTGISGTLGQAPPMIPVVVTVSRGGHVSDVLRGDVLNNRVLTPSIVGSVVVSGLYFEPQYTDYASVTMRAKLVLNDGLEVERRQVYSALDPNPTPAALRVAGDITALFGALYDNPFTPPHIVSVDVQVAVDTAPQQVRVLDLRAATAQPRAGRSLRLLLETVAYRGERHVTPVTFTPPANLSGTAIRIWAGSPSALSAAGLRIQPTGAEWDGARSLADLVESLSHSLADDEVLLVLASSAPDALVRNRFMPRLPVSMAAFYAATPNSAGTPGGRSAAVVARVPMPGIPIEGAAFVAVDLK
ncbi:MAG: hypothetical protein HYV63_19410 [Candidatus Schekmanbacteria bacterium]|nr:hypothetical protein [Candidatus Schekmanbacteria bacterium]